MAALLQSKLFNAKRHDREPGLTGVGSKVPRQFQPNLTYKLVQMVSNGYSQKHNCSWFSGSHKIDMVRWVIPMTNDTYGMPQNSIIRRQAEEEDRRRSGATWLMMSLENFQRHHMASFDGPELPLWKHAVRLLQTRNCVWLHWLCVDELLIFISFVVRTQIWYFDGRYKLEAPVSYAPTLKSRKRIMSVFVAGITDAPFISRSRIIILHHRLLLMSEINLVVNHHDFVNKIDDHSLGTKMIIQQLSLSGSMRSALCLGAAKGKAKAAPKAPTRNTKRTPRVVPRCAKGLKGQGVAQLIAWWKDIKRTYPLSMFWFGRWRFGWEIPSGLLKHCGLGHQAVPTKRWMIGCGCTKRWSRAIHAK